MWALRKKRTCFSGKTLWIANYSDIKNNNIKHTGSVNNAIMYEDSEKKKARQLANKHNLDIQYVNNAIKR